MTCVVRWAIFFLIPLKLIMLMTNEALKLMQSKQDMALLYQCIL